MRRRAPVRVVPVNDDLPPVYGNWWSNWGKSVALLVLAVLGFVGAIVLAGWLVSLLL